jgi:hypothetical protein
MSVADRRGGSAAERASLRRLAEAVGAENLSLLIAARHPGGR